jgi:UMF1 family MFS transporter
MSSKRIKNGWAFYDWANSVYSLVIATAIFPIYFSSISPEILSLAGYDFESAALYSYSLAAAFIVVAILSPVLSGIADYSGNKKLFMQIFAYLGSASCLSLYFFNDSNIFFGLTMSALASIGFWGSLVFYNAFLPEIAKPEEQDALSAKGFSLGYIGSSLLLIFNLLMITFPESFGISDAGQASRISFLTVAIWWAGFAQITFRRLPRLPTNINNRKPKESGYLWRGFRELKIPI